MAARQPASIQGDQGDCDEIPLQSLEESLLSLEKMDRASPELFPEQIPGVSGFAPLKTRPGSPPVWVKGFTPEDINSIHHLSTLSTSGLIMEVKKLHDSAYQLGLAEAKEMTRGMYLDVFNSKKQ